MASSSSTAPPSSPSSLTKTMTPPSEPPPPPSPNSEKVVIPYVGVEGSLSAPDKTDQAATISPPPLVETMAARLNRRLSLQSSPDNHQSQPTSPLRSQVYRPPHRVAVHPPSPARRSDGGRQAPSPFHDWGRGRPRVTPRGENDPEFFLVGKLLSARPPNPNSLKGYFHSTWKLQGRLNILEKPEGRFVFVFGREADRRRILRSGPWKFNNALMVFAEYDGVQPLKDVALDKLEFWVDITGVSPAFHKKVLLQGPVTMENGCTQHLEFWYENLVGRCSKCGVLTHFGLPCYGAELPDFKPPLEVAPAVKTAVTEPPPLLRALLLQTAEKEVKQIQYMPKNKDKNIEQGTTLLAGKSVMESRPTKRNLEQELDMDAPLKPMVLIPPKRESVPERQRRMFKGKGAALTLDPKEKRERSDPMDIDEAAPLKRYKPSLAIVEASVLNEAVPQEAVEVKNALGVGVTQAIKRKKGRPFGSKNKVKKERLAPATEIQKNKLMSCSPSKSPATETSNEVSFPVTKPDPASPPKVNGGAASA